MNAIGKRITVAAALAGTALALVPAAGEAKQPQQRRFIATVQGSQTSTWFNQRTYGTRTCFGSSWVEGEGSQEFRFKSKPFKLLVYKSGTDLYFSYNSFRRDNYEFGVHVPITLKREGELRHGEDAGDCGGGSPTESGGPYDCGTKMSTFDAHLSENSLGNLELSVGTAIGYPFRSFQTCPFSTGPGVSDPWTDLDTPFSKKQIFRAQKAFDIKARASFTAEKPTRTTGVTWTLKLKPVK